MIEEMIPQLVSGVVIAWAVLPPGIHTAGLEEIKSRFAYNRERRDLFEGVVDAATRLRSAGCARIYLDGSYVTAKPKPNDFDGCWDPSGVDRERLDPVFSDLRGQRTAQKEAFKGEFFPSSMTCTDHGVSFLEFFQRQRYTSKKKGIIAILISQDPLLLRRDLP